MPAGVSDGLIYDYGGKDRHPYPVPEALIAGERNMPADRDGRSVFGWEKDVPAGSPKRSAPSSSGGPARR